MSFLSRILSFQYWVTGNRGEQWGIGVHDLDGNGFLDFYANHHGYQGLREVIYNFTTTTPSTITHNVGGDLHGVTFFDIDQDGDADLLQATGADSGMVTDPNHTGSWTRINLNEDGVLSGRNSVALFGLQYGLGSKRILNPVNLDGELAVYVGVLTREGGANGQFFLRNAAGSYDAFSPVAAEITGEIAKGVHFGTDGFTDILNFDWRAREVRVYENAGSGFGSSALLSSRSMTYDVVTGDFDGDLANDILLARSGNRERLVEKNAAGDWVGTWLQPNVTSRPTSSVALVAGDFNNDGALDYAALQHGDGVDVRLYLNRGDGTFQEGERFYAPTITGRAEFMISGDFDRDGALDLVVTTSFPPTPRNGAYVLLEGEAGQGNWLSLDLEGGISETGGLGARVYVTTPDGEVRMLEQDSGVHFTSQNSTDLHFGLGAEMRADVRIVWPDGFMQYFMGLTANQHLTLTERRSGFERVYAGGTLADDIRGTTLDELLIGGGGNDSIVGQAGDDELQGGLGHDSLYGGLGDDLLVGGSGGDKLMGREGADVFSFLAPSSSPLSGRLDVIGDFQRSIDRIDLSEMDADQTTADEQSFSFIGQEAFSGEVGELRFAGGLLSGDVDGDGRADFLIGLSGVVALAQADLVL